MKKISLFSKIIFILQAFVALYPWLWILAGILKFEVGVLLPIVMCGLHFTIPISIIGVLLCLVLSVKQRNDKKEVFKNIALALLHIVLGIWNFVLYNSLVSNLIY